MAGKYRFALAFLLTSWMFLSYGSATDFDTDIHEPYHDPKASSRSLRTRVVGGVHADMKRFPYFTFLTISTDQGEFTCGGTLVAPDVVMTAAHCYYTPIAKGYTIEGMTASVNMTQRYGGSAGSVYERKVSLVLSHPRYDYATDKNDVALFKLKNPVLRVPLPKLPQSGQTPIPGSRLKAIGLGRTDEQGTAASRLQVVDVSVISYTNCNDENSYRNKVDPIVMLCAGWDKGGKDTCNGDSGGPLLRQGGNAGQDVIIGITSWGEGCGRPNKFGVYTKVSSMVDFVRPGICQLSTRDPSFCANNRTAGKP